jgi:hypothetical protein
MKLKYLRVSDMGTDTHMEERLWNYIDGTCNPEERTEIERLLSNHPAWKTAHEGLLDTARLLKASELEQPSMRFTKNVMESIAAFQVAPATRTYINKNIIRAIGAFFALAIGGFVVYGFSLVDFSAGSTGNALPFNLPKPDLSFTKQIPSMFWNIFLMADAVLGLVFLDRYLARKRNQAADAN